MRTTRSVLKVTGLAGVLLCLGFPAVSGGCLAGNQQSIEVTCMDSACNEEDLNKPKPCDSKATLMQGAVDLDWTEQWLGKMQIKNTMESGTTSRVGAVNQSEGRNDFSIEWMHLTYLDERGAEIARAKPQALSGVVPAGGGTNNIHYIPLVTDEVRGRINPAPTQMVRVVIEYEGVLASGQRIRTGKYIYPILFWRSGVQAPAACALNVCCGQD